MIGKIFTISIRVFSKLNYKKGSMVLLLGLFLTACAGELRYSAPDLNNKITHSKIVDKSKDEIWKDLIPNLGKEFFVINNLDKESGLINISYSGDPLAYVDCGRIFSSVQNAQGKRVYDFEAAKENQFYEIYEHQTFYRIDRRMSLEGRVNLIIEETGSEQVLISANSRYVLKKTGKSHRLYPEFTQYFNDVIHFNTGSSATFPNTATQCIATGKLEADILSLVK